MHRNTQHYVLQQLANLYAVPILHFDLHSATLIDSFNTPSNDYSGLLRIQPSLLDPTTPAVNCFFDRDFLCFGHVRSAQDMLIVGPGKLCDLTEKDYREFEQRVRTVLPNVAAHAAVFIRQAPLLGLATILNSLSTLNALYNDCVISPQAILPQNDLTEILATVQRQLIIHKQARLATPKTIQPDMQDRIATYVRHGLLQQLRDYLNTVDYHLEKLGPTMLRHYQNGTIILNSLCMRAAIHGGVDADTCYALGGYYIKQIESVTSSETLNAIYNAMIIDYCQRVRQEQILHVDDPTISACLGYIENHLDQKLTVTLLASTVNISPTYLSTRFKQQTHYNLPDYINQRRIESSKELLSHSDMPIADIAAYFAFSHQSYYQTLFKQQVGQTPLQYRKKSTPRP